MLDKYPICTNFIEMYVIKKFDDQIKDSSLLYKIFVNHSKIHIKSST